MGPFALRQAVRRAGESGAGQHTDFGEKARMAVTEVLGTVAGREPPSVPDLQVFTEGFGYKN